MRKPQFIHRALTWLAILAAAIGIIVVGGGLSASAASPDDPVKDTTTTTVPPQHSLPDGFASVDEFRQVQDRLHKVATALTTSAGNRAGFTGVAVSIPHRSVTLYWQGELPSDVAATVSLQQSRAQIVVQPARYSHRQLLAKADKIVAAARATDVKVTRVAVPVHGRGIQVGVSGPVSRARQLPQLAGSDVILSQEKPATSLYSRVDDSPPFWGGARIINQRTGSRCSTGFGIRRDATGDTAMLTAGHCGENGDTFTTGLGTYTVGQAASKEASFDTMLIPTRAAARVYTDHAWSSNSTAVSGTQTNYVGEYLCTHGAYSGYACDVVVTGLYQFVYTDVGRLGPLVRADQLQGRSAAGKGDSGGPVISLWPDGMKANGTISAGANQVPCNGEQGRFCGSTVWYADINLALQLHNASILTQ